MKMLITLEPHGIFGSNFVYLCILTLVKTTGMNKGNEASPIIIFAGRAFMLKLLITLELTAWYIWFKFCIFMCYNIVQPLV